VASVVMSERRARRESAPARHVDLLLMGSVLATCAIGLAMIYSASHARLEKQGLDPLYFVKRQAVFMIIGVAVMGAVMAVDYRKIRDFAPIAYGALVFVLAAVVSPLGTRSKGTQGWFQLPGGLQLQPSEFSKFLLIIGLAGFLYQHRGELDAYRLAIACFIVGLPLALVMMQPDLGTAMVIAIMSIAMLTVAGVRGRHMLVLVLIGITAVIGIWHFDVLKQYQVDRLTTFLNAGKDTQGAAYNQDQGRTAIANGGLLGQGYLSGSQTEGGFVPEQHTDFIFTAVGEELGFVGSALLLALFALMIWRIWRTGAIARDLFGTLVCVGVVAMFAFQIFESIGMTMAIMPITGIPLPFMSYGGSSVITCFACIGLVANVHMRRFS
jgi:rod shape determining protein RodA